MAKEKPAAKAASEPGAWDGIAPPDWFDEKRHRRTSAGIERIADGVLVDDDQLPVNGPLRTRERGAREEAAAKAKSQPKPAADPKKKEA